MTHKVLIADELSPRAVEILREQGIEVVVQTGLVGPELVRALAGVHGLAVRSQTKVTAEVLAAADALKVVGRAGIGVDNIDVAAASRRGVVVMNTPSGNAVTTAEHALCLLLSLARHIPQATASIKAGKWDKKRFEGTELCEKTLGVVGLGNIGRIVADRALGLKMRVCAYDPVLTPDAAAKLGVELVPLDEVFRRADAITVHTPLTADTRGLVGKDAFAKMKRGVLIVNAARGGIVDEAALLAALESGQVAGAALDVFTTEPPPKDHPVLTPLLAHPRVIATPHLGASTEEAQEKVAVEVAEQIAAFLARGEVKNAVNLPPVSREAQAKVAPFTDLAGRLGALAAQLIGSFTEVEIEVAGELSQSGAKPVTAAAVAGLLRPLLSVPVNEVNALLLAAERGIKVSETRAPHAANFTSSVSLRVAGPSGQRFVKGTVYQSGGALEPRVVQIDNYLIDAVPSGTVLIVANQDKPGVIGAVGTALGARGINVSRMQVGLDAQRGEALQLWNVDGAPDASLLDLVRAAPHVRTATLVAL